MNLADCFAGNLFLAANGIIDEALLGNHQTEDTKNPGGALFTDNLPLAVVEIIDEALLAENHQTKDTEITGEASQG